MSKWSSTAIEVCQYYYLSAPNGEKNKKNGINFAVESRVFGEAGSDVEFWWERPENIQAVFTKKR